MSVLLPEGTNVSEVALTVADVSAATSFYQRTLGLRVLGGGDDACDLGVGDQVIVRLAHGPGARSSRGTVRLYHFAVLLPSRRDLALALGQLLHAGWPLDGASDHLVSEALYLSDPEGNGIELYRDRPRDEWPVKDGQVQLATFPLDVKRLLAEAEGSRREEMPAGTRLGHIHLQVSDIAACEHFYENVVGFELMARYGDSASFLGAGGYHHHVAVNVWGTRGAPPALDGTLGLAWYRLSLPTPESLADLERRLEEALVIFEKDEGEVRFRDPSGHRLIASVELPHA